jgi:hypothetical protein
MFLKFSRFFFLNNSLAFKIKIFSFLSYLNLYIKNFTSKKKNKTAVRLLDWFRSRDFKFKKPRSRKLFVYPRNILFFDYFSVIKGLNDEHITTKNQFGKIITFRDDDSKKLNTP